MDDTSDFDFDEQVAFEDDHMQAVEKTVLLPPSEDEAEEAAPVLLPLDVAAPEEPVVVVEADVAARRPSPQPQEEVESSLSKRTCLVFKLSLSHTMWRIAKAMAMSRPEQGPACIAILEVEVVFWGHSSVLVWNQSSGFRGSGQVGGLSSGVSITCIGESG